MEFDESKHVVHLADGKCQDDTDLSLIVRTALQHERGILINVHGGLVSYKNALSSARPLFAAYSNKANPIFIVWETGILESPLNNITEIFGRIAEKRLFKWILRKILSSPKFVGFAELDGVEDGSLLIRDEDVQSLANEIQADPEAWEAMQEAKDDYYAAQHQRIPLKSQGLVGAINVEIAAVVDPSTAAELFGEGAATNELSWPFNWLELSRKILIISLNAWQRRRAGRGRDGEGHWDIVEEVLREFYVGDVGANIWWRPMKKDAEDAFSGAGAGGTKLLVELDKQIKATGKRPQITLVGHSAGSIFICRLLDKAKEVMPDQAFDVIFEAPAVTCKDFASTIGKHVTGLNPPRIRKFRQFGMRDADERSEIMKPFLSRIYHGSLLYFVSNVLEHDYDVPLVGMERFFSKSDTYDRSRSASSIRACRAYLYPPNGKSRVDWVTLDDIPADERPRPQLKHEHFDSHQYFIGKVMQALDEK